MSLDDARNDREAEAGAAGLASVTPPETTEDELALAFRDAWSVVEDAHRSVRRNLDLDRRSLRRVVDGVLGEVADGVEQRLRIALDPHRLFGARERDAPALRQRQGRDEGRYLGRDALQIRLLFGGDDESLELGDLEELAHDAAHAVDILAQ